MIDNELYVAEIPANPIVDGGVAEHRAAAIGHADLKGPTALAAGRGGLAGGQEQQHHERRTQHRHRTSCVEGI
jgi:hypothetical protein